MGEKKQEVQLEWRNVDDLIPYVRNARTHSAEQVLQIAGSIKEFGFVSPVVISEDGGILAGHGRVLAAKKLKMKKVPCVVESHLSEAQRRAFIIADNKLSLNAGWNNDLLKIELSELKDLDFDIDLLGFSVLEVKDIMAESWSLKTLREEFKDKIEEPVEEVEHPVSRVGDLWILGEHRVINGDCTDKEIVSKLLGDNKPNLMVTDPPYGINFRADAKNKDWDVSKALGFAARGGNNRRGEVLNDDREDWTECYKLFPGNVMYVWHSHLHERTVWENIEACGFEIVVPIIWNKGNASLGRGDYHWKHEVALYAVRKGEKHNWQGARDQSTVWDISNITQLSSKEGAWGHGTQKPIECMMRPMLNNSAKGEYVYDPFLGSGTSIIAGERCERKVLGCELNPVYVDTIIRRWEQETGNKAVRASDKAFYDDLRAGLDAQVENGRVEG